MTGPKTIALAGALMLSAAIPAAAETFNFTVIAGHPPLTKGVSAISTHFVPEVTRRAAELGHTVNWTEAYAGSVAPPTGVLEAVESGVAEFGYVPQLFEGDKLPLDQITYITPFGTSDLVKLMEVIDALYAEIPAMSEAWEDNNQKVLAPVGIDTYHFVTKFPIETVSDLDGSKIGTAGLALNWLKGVDATPVAGALPDFYNAMSTGLYDGVMTFESVVAPYKFYEVAPYITKINFGAQYASALTVNLDTWNTLPEDMQQIIQEAANGYRDIAAESYREGGEASLATAVEGGAILSELSDEERAAYANKLPNIAREWADQLDAQGLPGTEVLETYMRLSREAGITHARDWTAE
ncbi:C4-dicarboxylate TRAP transporter substrate-binding protein [Anianabacter salinae]|uniref:C4-dicarboxylate TRAP transporter substrate-binding protein n=1 Tax=Anianabacter salinae TaxID=2851023 RepID=UPI00225E0E20|nr:C4-dicarboxylate TRAP transporter substrate-binding protein [Anianabacter salinae]MBV0911169.1 C4-dicarboxylate TRAP transporter substrate-binding protein [Anianabacter salinae]